MNRTPHDIDKGILLDKWNDLDKLNIHKLYEEKKLPFKDDFKINFVREFVSVTCDDGEYMFGRYYGTNQD